MYYRLNAFAFVRNINNFLQIVDKRDDSELFGDYIAYLFAKHLDYSPLHIDTIVNNVCSEFSGNIDFSVVKKDTVDFLERLVDLGLVSICDQAGKTIDNVPKDGKLVKPRVLLPKEELEKIRTIMNQKPCLQNISVQITQKCNERCVHCYIPHENKNRIMSDNDFYRIADMCSEMKTIVNFRITGGECMSHPSFKKFVEYVKGKGFSLTLLTNLTLLDDETIDILKRGLFSQVQVSMFSLTPEIHDNITKVNGSLEKTLKNLEKLKKAGVPVAIATQAMEINKDSIEGLYEYAKNQGIELRCDWTIVAKENRKSDNLSHRIRDFSTYKKLCKLKLQYVEGYKEELSDELAQALKPENTHLCYGGVNGLYVDTALKVHPCPGWDLIVGDLKSDSLSDIWNKSEILQKIRNVVLKDFPKCAKCDIRNLCSICMAQADMENIANDFEFFEMPEYVCSMYKVIYNTIQEEVFGKN